MNFVNPSGKRNWAKVVVLVAWLWTGSVFGDGKVFPAIAYPADVQIPDQSALIVWSNGVERLVIETRFVGEGTNFAWVVPLPAVPEIEPATTGLFPTLRICLQPDVRHSIANFWALALLVCGLIWLLATVRADKERSVADLVGCVVTAAGAACIIGVGPGSLIGGLLLCLLLIFAVERVRTGREQTIAILIVLFFALLFSSLLLPTLGTAGSATATPQGIKILDRKIVGIFETTVINAKEPKALLGWLAENGFAADPRGEPVIEQYIKDGWVFVTAKVHRDTANSAAATPHPLSFTFKSASPVYPLRLTAVGNEQLGLELFVVGALRAEISGFKVTECRLIVKETGKRPKRARPDGKFGHALFNDWVGNLPVITKLEARLKPADMIRDAVVAWRDFAPARTRVYSLQGATLWAANLTVIPMAVLVLITGLLVNQDKLRPVTAWKLAAIATLVWGMVGAGMFLSLSKVEVRLERYAARRNEGELQRLGSLAQGLMPTNQPPTFESVRAAIQQAQRELPFENLLHGGGIHEEDSPGNYSLREMPTGFDLLGYGPSGTADVLFTFEQPAVSLPPHAPSQVR